MCPIASLQLDETSGWGGLSRPAAVAFLLCVWLGSGPSLALCPTYCLCASDIVSCSGRNLSSPPFDLPVFATRLDLSHNALSQLSADWIPQQYDRLSTLVLSRNTISGIEVNAFSMMPYLHHLDLSSNCLTGLNSSIFTGLRQLKELLLYDNKIIHINHGAFSDLGRLSKLYLSGNQLTTFPSSVFWAPEGPRNLTFLDLSSNQISEVPVQTLVSLTQQAGIYLQGNPLVCDCALMALLQYWMWRQYRPLLDFTGQYSCGAIGSQLNCSQEDVPETLVESTTYQAEPGQSLWIPCPGFKSPVTKELLVYWITPRTVLNSSTADVHFDVFSNGTLRIRRSQAEDAGKYICVAVRGRLYHPYESLEVKVLVGNMSGTSTSARSGAEHFNTAFTTLASCVVSIVLVLLYLYLTPCRCSRSQGGGSRGCGGRAFTLCSDPRDVDSGQRRANGKRVAFLEPQEENCPIGSAKIPVMNLGHVTTEGILKNGSRPVGQTLTDSALMA
ncbi:amphoterin-induced protein 2-like [Synchiropus picturatus]